jgi:tRNA threonylcarbamoyl adenosine modification protein YeaZ
MTPGAARYLALETSSSQLSLAVGDDRRVLDMWSGEQEWRHAESLLSGIETILKKRRWPLATLTGIAVSIGPGSFTGIRIGLSAARALGQFLRIPVVGISALEILAYGSAGAVIAPALNGLQEQVFAGLYRRKTHWKRLAPDVRWPREHWQQICRQWAKKYGPLTVVDANLSNVHPRADHLLQLAAPRLLKAGPDSYKRVLPLYLRDASPIERLKAGVRSDKVTNLS